MEFVTNLICTTLRTNNTLMTHTNFKLSKFKMTKVANSFFSVGLIFMRPVLPQCFWIRKDGSTQSTKLRCDHVLMSRLHMTVDFFYHLFAIRTFIHFLFSYTFSIMVLSSLIRNKALFTFITLRHLSL